jgi:GNAT superfamily N-acetyltransferase
MTISVGWRGDFSSAEVNALHAEAFEHDTVSELDRRELAERCSLGWVIARDAEAALFGFANVLSDGGRHAWLQDVIVARRAQRQGLGRRLVALASEHAREAGCEWLHVDFEPQVAAYYFDSCGFAPTQAGLLRLDR